ncbi:type II secretion system F family protein [Candidatus Saccharibacteria bacterium]|nr:type II secretion system F family protein [Candidatus Saccharibacteria bacterium]
MKRFNYKAKELKTGKMVKGVVQADNEHAAGKLLVEQGYAPESIREEDKNSFIAKLTNKVSGKDRIVFTRQFATLIGAGLPLSDSLRTLVEQTQSKPMKAVVEDILANVEAGKSLSEALKLHPDVFNTVYLSLVAAGEMSGTLDTSLERLANQDEKDEAMLSSIRGAMIYPAILFVVIIAVLVFMMVQVVPQVVDLYDSMDETLPSITQVLVSIMGFLMSTWGALLVVLVIAIALLNQYRKTTAGKRVFALVKLNVPIFKGLFQRLYMTRFARTMEMLLGTGVAMLDAMKISAKATANAAVEGILLKAADKVKAGKPLSESLKDKDYILPLVPQMASIGEESGKIDEMLGRAATVYENELDEKIKNISTLIEPVLMVIMAALIGVVLMGTLMPIYSLVSSI